MINLKKKAEKKKMKKKHAILAITLGALLLGFIPAVVANGKVVERPLDDWLDANYAAFPWGEENWAFSDFVSPYTWLVAKMGFPFPKAGIGPFVNDMVYENSLVVGDTIISGKVKERELDTGEALITLHLDVKNAPLTVYDIYEFLFYCRGWAPEPQAVLGEGIDGYIDYKVLVKFIIPEPGAPLPDCFAIYDNYISVNIHGIGYGTLTEHAVELGFAENAGAMGMLKLHQIALFKPDFKEDHPKYDPFYGDLWPVETVEIFEL
jgi:hypothetical protein